MKYGLDVKAPTTIPGDDPWKPVMKNTLARYEFDSSLLALLYMDEIQKTNGRLEVRIVELTTSDPVYSL